MAVFVPNYPKLPDKRKQAKHVHVRDGIGPLEFTRAREADVNGKSVMQTGRGGDCTRSSRSWCTRGDCACHWKDRR